MRPDRKRFDTTRCSIAATLAVVGDKWTLLVMREAFLGLRRYDELLEALGCARNILSDRLRKLVAHDLLDRVAYREPGRRERHEYQLTERGRELYPVLLALMQWGDRWLAGADGPPVLVEHLDCRARVHAELRCTAGHGPLTSLDTLSVPRPGVRTGT